MITYLPGLMGLAFLCAALLVSGYRYQRGRECRDRTEIPPPGRLIDVGGHRLHLLCKGSGGPTVIIEQGAGEPARFWWSIQDQVAEFAQVCTYDRAGYGWSDAVHPGRSIDARARDLHALLTRACLAGPFVFVAHSYGGLIVRRFAQQHPELAAGFVLVDTPEESVLFRPAVLRFYSRLGALLRIAEWMARFGVLRLLARRYPIADFGFSYVRPGEYAAAIDDLSSLELVDPPMRLPGGFGTLLDQPLAVLTHGLPFPGPFSLLEDGWRAGQADLAAMSSAGELIVAEKSNHMIQHDEPDLVLQAIRRVHVAVCAHAVRKAESGLRASFNSR